MFVFFAKASSVWREYSRVGWESSMSNSQPSISCRPMDKANNKLKPHCHSGTLPRTISHIVPIHLQSSATQACTYLCIAGAAWTGGPSSEGRRTTATAALYAALSKPLQQYNNGNGKQLPHYLKSCKSASPRKRQHHYCPCFHPAGTTSSRIKGWTIATNATTGERCTAVNKKVECLVLRYH